MLAQAEIDHLTDITSDAYSFDRYASWRACVAMLARRGYTYAETETILRSKWMRWAGDSSDKRYGRVTSRDLERWLDRCAATTCSRAQLDSMLAEMGLLD